MATVVEHAEPRHFRPTGAGVAARAGAAILILIAVLLVPLLVKAFGRPGTAVVWGDRIALAAIYAIIGLSVNIITGHAGQISLGHQAFVGIGAFTSAFVASSMGAGFGVALPAAGLVGAAMALLLGLVALRIRGLYFALVTLAFGLMTEVTIFKWRAFTAGGAGALAPRPSLFDGKIAYAYLCLLILAAFLLIDWRLLKTKAGRAIVAVRNDERVAATLGISVTRYKLLAFAVGGFAAGVAGSLFAHWNTVVTDPDFELRIALVWILMTIVGGLGSRAGVVIGSAFFALFPYVFGDIAGGSTWNLTLPVVGKIEILVVILAPLFGALLLLLTLTLYPGGIGQQLAPIRRWLAGGPFVDSRHEAVRAAGLPAFVVLVAAFLLLKGGLGTGLALAAALVLGAGTAVVAGIGLIRYARAVRSAPGAPDATAVPGRPRPPVDRAQRAAAGRTSARNGPTEGA